MENKLIKFEKDNSIDIKCKELFEEIYKLNNISNKFSKPCINSIGEICFDFNNVKEAISLALYLKNKNEIIIFIDYNNILINGDYLSFDEFIENKENLNEINNFLSIILENENNKNNILKLLKTINRDKIES